MPYDGHGGELLRLAGDRPIDVALLPINGRGPSGVCRGTSGATRRPTFAHDVGAGVVVPMHYDMFAFNTETPELFVATADRLGQPHRVLRLRRALDLDARQRGAPR